MRQDALGRAGAVGAVAAGTGAALGVAATAACCVSPVISPIIVAVLGVGGAAWAAGLGPYAPYLLAGSALLLGFGFWVAYGRQRACAVEDRRRSPLWLRAVLWSGAFVWVVSLGLTLFLPR